MRSKLIAILGGILIFISCKKDVEPLVIRKGVPTDTLEIIHRDSIANLYVPFYTPLFTYGNHLYTLARFPNGFINRSIFQKRDRLSGVVVDELELGNLILDPKTGILENGKYFIFGYDETYIIDLETFEKDLFTSRANIWNRNGHAAVGDLYIYFGMNNPSPKPGTAVYSYNLSTDVETYLFTIEDPDYDDPSDRSRMWDLTAWRGESGDLYVAVVVTFELIPRKHELWIYNANQNSIAYKLNLNTRPDDLWSQYYENRPIYYDEYFDQLYVLTERLNAIDPYNGQIKWTSEIESDSWISQVRCTKSGVYWLDDHNLNFVNGLDGSTIFSQETYGIPVATLNIQQNVIPIGSSHTLLILDKLSGELVYRAVEENNNYYYNYSGTFIDWENRRLYYYFDHNFVCARLPEHWK
jgi:hypothetical protein